ncbi:Serine/threonine protein phosphatase, partial [Dysosmobacter welbionis]
AKDGVFRSGIADIPVMQLILCRRRFPPVHLHTAQQRLHLHQQYRWAEGLGEIIVTALTDAHDVIQLAVLGRKQDDGNIGNRAKLPAHGKSVRAGHHNVQ